MPTSTSTEVTDKTTCKICRRQFSKYSCPTCNVAYCSLSCFRSEAHSRCSETFYRKEVESDIRSTPSRSSEERHKMMELLAKLEQEASEDASAVEDDEEEGDITDRLGALDLDSANADTIWDALSPEERRKFVKAVEDPSSELARQLVADGSVAENRRGPWWEGTELLINDGRQYGSPPRPLHLPVEMVESPRDGTRFIYNLCAVLIAYAYVSRHFATSPLSSFVDGSQEKQEARAVFSRLAPFVTQSKSSTLHSSCSETMTDVLSRFNSGEMNPRFYSVVLEDAAELLSPSAVSVLSTDPSSRTAQESKHVTNDDINSHPNRRTLLALSDVHCLFERKPFLDGTAKRPMVAGSKLLFYAAHVYNMPTGLMAAASKELRLQARMCLQEDPGVIADGQTVGPKPEEVRKKVFVEEL